MKKLLLWFSPLLLLSTAHAMHTPLDTTLNNLLRCKVRTHDSSLPNIIDVLSKALVEMHALRTDLEFLCVQATDATSAVLQLSSEINRISESVHGLIGGDAQRVILKTQDLKPRQITVVEKAITRIEKALSMTTRDGALNLVKIVEALEVAITEITHVRDELRNLNATSVRAIATINGTALAIATLAQRVGVLVGEESAPETETTTATAEIAPTEAA